MKLIVNNFGRIENNFGSQTGTTETETAAARVTQLTSTVEEKLSERDDFKQNFLKIFDSNTNSNSNNCNNKSDKSNKENSKPTKPQAPVIKLAEVNHLPPLLV